MRYRICVISIFLLISHFETFALERIVKVNRKNIKKFYSVIAKFTSGQNVCLITNQSVTGQLLLLPSKNSKHSYLEDIFSNNNIKIIKLLTPEHGLSSLEEVDDSKRTKKIHSDYKLISLYSKTVAEIQRLFSNCSDIIYDLPDAGIRSYTYRTILTRTITAVSKMEKKPQYLLIDRPNPAAFLGTHGPIANKKQYSYLGENNIPFFPGYTYAEITRRFIAQNHLQLNIVYFTMSDYYIKKQPKLSVALPPSPNIPDDRALHCYWMGVFLEGTNLDYGRNSNDPFCTFGHREIDYRRPLPILNGVKIVPFQYKTSAGKRANEQVKGYRIVSIDLNKFEPMKVAYRLYFYFIETYPDMQLFHKYESGVYKIDLLTGSTIFRSHLQSRKRYTIMKRKLAKQILRFKRSIESYRLY